MIKLISFVIVLLAMCVLDTGSVSVPRTENSKFIVPTVSWVLGTTKDVTKSTAGFVADSL